MRRNGEFLAFMEAEDSSEGLFKVAVHRKVYECLQRLSVLRQLEKVKHITHSNVHAKDFTFRILLRAAVLIRPSVEPSVSVKSFHICRSLPLSTVLQMT